MYPRNFTEPVPSAGIRTKSGESVAGCFRCRDDFRGPAQQLAYRNHKLGEAGVRTYVPGVLDSEPPSGLVFGVKSGTQNYTTSDCVKMEPTAASKPYLTFMEHQEDRYLRNRDRLGQCPVSRSIIPEELMKTGFGVSTKFGESAGAVIQNTRQSLPNDPTLQTGYQTKRNYNWHRIDPLNHAFGIKGSAQIDHLEEMLRPEHDVKIVPIAVDRAEHNAIVPDPNPLDMATGTRLRTLRASQIRAHQDPSKLSAAGVSTKNTEFSMGDTIAEMGTMDAFDADYDKEFEMYDPVKYMTHGITTKPNPFPNPLHGPGRYVNLGLSDEDFLKLRDRQHLVPVMVQGLYLEKEEADKIFTNVSGIKGRDKISVAEFHEEYKKQQN